jgi:hypothetical protein
MPPSSAAAWQSLQDFNATKKKSEDIVTGAQDKYGVSGLQGQLNQLRSLTGNLQQGIENVDPSVTGRTQGSLVTEAQRQKLVNTERAPLVGQFNKTSEALADTGQQYGQATGLASQLAQMQIGEQDTTYKNLFDQYGAATAREAEAARQAEIQRQYELEIRRIDEENRRWQAEFAQEQARYQQQLKSSNSGLNLAGLLGSSAGAAAASTSANKNNPGGDAGQVFSLIQTLRQAPGGRDKWGWANLAAEFQRRGMDVKSGSAADRALRAYFAAGQ